LIVREIENVLKSLPAFLKIWTRVRNPLSYRPGNLADEKDGTNWFETATQSLWFTVPVCFFGLYGLIPDEKTSRLVLLAAILLVPLGVAWLGSLFGSVQAVLRREKIQVSRPGKPILLNSYLHDWVIALMIGWFYIGFLLSAVEAIAIRWLDIRINILSLINGLTPLEDDLFLLGSVPLVAVIALIVTMGRCHRGSVPQVIAFALTSFLTFVGALALVLYLIEIQTA
jgi:hypothetical protein